MSESAIEDSLANSTPIIRRNSADNILVPLKYLSIAYLALLVRRPVPRVDSFRTVWRKTLRQSCNSAIDKEDTPRTNSS